ncbi:MAG: HAD family hydrolase [Anaerolineales bacterium]
MHRLKAVLFDIDDTLLDWSMRQQTWEDQEWEHLNRVYDYVDQHVHPLHNRDHFFEDTLGYIIEHWQVAKRTFRAPHLGQALVESLVAQGVPREAIDMTACLHAYGAEAFPGLRPYPEVPAVLEALQARGLRLGLITNSIRPMHMREIELRQTGLWAYFEADGCGISAADIGYIKPHAAIFRAALARLSVTPEEAVFVGDSLKADISGAQGVQMRAILRQLPNPAVYADFAAPPGIQPDGVITSLDELLPLLDEFYPAQQDGNI